MKVFEDINKLIVEGSLAVGNHSIVLDFVLGSDYKVIVIIIIMMYSTDSMSTSQYLLIVMGLNDSTSNYACLWCTVHREERFVNKHVNNLLLQFYRWDMSLSADCCSLASLVEAASRPPKEQLGSKHLPLLHLELDHVVIDIYYI